MHNITNLNGLLKKRDLVPPCSVSSCQKGLASYHIYFCLQGVQTFFLNQPFTLERILL